MHSWYRVSVMVHTCTHDYMVHTCTHDYMVHTCTHGTELVLWYIHALMIIDTIEI